ncbi:MAG: trypsin-like serine peptidase [Aeoliella sp.]
MELSLLLQQQELDLASRRNCLGLVVFLISLAQVSIAGSPVEDAISATFRIFSPKNSGTAFLVATDDEQQGRSAMLVTAAHVLEESPDADWKIVLRTRKPDSTIERLEWSFPIREEDQPRWKKHGDQDIAALRIELPKDAEVKPLALDQIADESFVREGKVAVGDSILVPGFPAQLEANDEGFPVVRRGIIATHPLWPVKSASTILANCQTWGGDSGAPVFAIHEGKPVVVGLIHGMQRQTDKVTSPFEERTIHTPLGLAIVIQAPFIREVIE